MVLVVLLLLLLLLLMFLMMLSLLAMLLLVVRPTRTFFRRAPMNIHRCLNSGRPEKGFYLNKRQWRGSSSGSS